MNRIEIAFKAVGLVICLLFVIFSSQNQLIEYSIFFVALTFLGIPHGAIDHLTSEPEISKKGFLTFLISYISLIACYLISWIFFPIFSLIAFLLMSGYHFGQTHFINRSVQKSAKALLYTSRGIFFLLLILSGDFELTQEILDPILNVSSLSQYLILILSGSLILTVIVQWISKVKFTRSDLFELLVLAPILYFSPLMIGFIVYFSFWHALPSMISEYKFLKRYPNYNTVKKFAAQLIPFSAISLIGIAIILILGMNYLNASELILVFFILISLISFPHILYMDRFWNKATRTGRF